MNGCLWKIYRPFIVAENVWHQEAIEHPICQIWHCGIWQRTTWGWCQLHRRCSLCSDVFNSVCIFFSGSVMYSDRSHGEIQLHISPWQNGCLDWNPPQPTWSDAKLQVDFDVQLNAIITRSTITWCCLHASLHWGMQNLDTHKAPHTSP